MLFWALVGLLVFIVGRAIGRATRDPIDEYISGRISNATAFWVFVAFVGLVTMAVNLLRLAWTFSP